MTALPLRDPTGLLQRSPELAELAQRSPALRRAIEGGRPHAAYRALFWAHKLGRFGDQSDVARQLLAHRRIFFKPLTSAPVMFTYNFVGTVLYGRGDLDTNDGTYVATLYAVVLMVPIFPIASYLVRDAAGSRRAWSFMAKVPPSTLTYVWQRSIALGILALVFAGAASAFHGYGHNTLHVVNGLDRAVHLEIGGRSAGDVGPGGDADLPAVAGKQTVTVKDGDRVLESQEVDIAHGRHTLVWNVLGAAPVFVAEVVYGDKGGASGGKHGQPDVYCGRSFLELWSIDYSFVDPPQSIQASESSGDIVKRHVGVASGGLPTCLVYLSEKRDAKQAVHLAMAVATAEQTRAADLPDATEALVSSAPLAEAEPFAKALLARDDSVAAHRLYQNVLMANGLGARAISEYDERRAARPDDADAAYLAVRTRTLDEERKVIDGLVAKYPQHAYLRRVQVFVHYATAEFAEMLGASEVLRRLDEHQWEEGLEGHVEALVAVGRGPDALDITGALGTDTKRSVSERRTAQILGYRVAHRTGGVEPAVAPEEGDEGWFPLWLRVRSGQSVSSSEVDAVKDEHVKAALRIMAAARSAPDGALSLVRSAETPTIDILPPVVRMLLLAEAWRKDETRPLVTKLAGFQFPQKTVDAATAYVDGTASDDVSELPLELRAALDFERSRSARASGAEKKAALERAKKGDVLRGPVSVAIAGWPS